MYLELIRMETSKYGTLGVLKIDGQLFCNTLEPPDKENKVNVSNVPTGQYWLAQYDSPSKGLVWKVKNVHNRSYIEFHPGNTVEHTAGCILIGESQGKLRGPEEHTKIINSGKTFDKFMSILDEGLHKLTVKEVY